MRFFSLFAALFAVGLYASDTVNIIPADGSTTTTPASTTSQSTVTTLPASVEEADESVVLAPQRSIIISVVGQGVAPMNTTSPAQAYALAKRAAIADGYRLIAEKVKGVEIQGQDLVKNMMVQRSTVRTAVYAIVRNANVVETTFRDGLCEVEMEIKLSYEDLAQ